MRVVAQAAFLVVALRLSATAACNGDCNSNNVVGIEELRLAVSAALTTQTPSLCVNADSNVDGKLTIEDLVAAVNSAVGGCPTAPTPIFPADYRSSFVEVRSCRIGNEHDGFAIRVLASPDAAEGYLAESNPLPLGSIVLKEEFDAATCDDDSKLVRRSVMRKEEAGFDPLDGDWHWQRIRVDGSLFLDGKSTCISCHRAPACKARDYMCEEPLQPATPTLVFQELPATLWSISGTSPADVYAVGGDPTSDDFGPYVLNYNGTRWVRLRSPVTGGALRWISVSPVDGGFFMAGDNGVILKFDLTTRQFAQYTTPSHATLYGVWGSDATHVWAVGADPNSPSEDTGGVLWRYDGNTWQVEDLSGVRPAGVPTLFKVWGRSDADVYVVGQRGVVLHYDGTTWSQLTSNTDRPLITVHGNSRETIAVGGFESGVIIEQNGNEFVDRTPSGLTQQNGLFVPEQGGGVAVGNEGSFTLRSGTGWDIQGAADTVFGFHATWVDPEGGVWVAGGDLNTDLKHGMVGYSGLRSVSGQIVDIDPCAFEPGSGPTTVSFAADIVPLFAQTGCKNASCHTGPQNLAASRYTMTAYSSLFKQGAFAKALKLCPVVPGSPDTSFLVEKLQPIVRANSGLRMPIGATATPLSAEQIDVVRTWILEGAQNN